MKNEITEKRNEMSTLQKENKLLEKICAVNETTLKEREVIEDKKDLEEESNKIR